MTPTVAALYVSPKGPYWGRPDVDAWDEERDARLYDVDLPVVAHPPCGRWCRMAKFVESRYPHLRVGEDGGCFAAALAAVRRCGGVLEHPAWSLAWSAHGLPHPPARGWQRDLTGGWCCEVAQSAYGHAAQKLTWLYYVGQAPPELDWSRPTGTMVVGHCARRGDGSIWRNNAKRMHGFEASRTPLAFAELLLSLARGANGGAQ